MDYILEFLSIYASYMLSLLTFFMGLMIGHRLALGRDKRKEFNEKATELNSKIYDYLKQNSNSFIPSIKDLTLFTPYIPLSRRSSYSKVVRELEVSLSNDIKSKKYNPSLNKETGDPNYVSQTNPLVHKLVRYLKRI